MRELVISKRARHERVSRKMIRAMEKQMYTTVSDSRDEEFATSTSWINRFLRCTNFLGRRQLLPTRSQRFNREAGEVCDIFILNFCEEGIKRLSQINTWCVKTYWWLMAVWWSGQRRPKRDLVQHARPTVANRGCPLGLLLTVSLVYS